MYNAHRISIAATFAICLAGLHAQTGKPAKNVKDSGEYEIYDAVVKDIDAKNFAKALADLDKWKQKYAQTDYEDERQSLSVEAYKETNEPAKAVDQARDLAAKDVYAALGNARAALRFLVSTAMAIQQVAAPTPEQLTTANKAAEALAAFDHQPEGVTPEAWAQARSQLQAMARATLLYVALVPGTQAMKTKDCAAAETAFVDALKNHPESGQAAWLLGTAELCLYKTQPDRASRALYSLARAAALDPAKAMVNPKWQHDTVEPFLDKVYAQYHGADPEGLRQLKEQAAQSALPPPGFKVKSVIEIAQEQEAELARTNPQLALWVKIKAALSESGGEQYFTSSLKDSAVSQLRGVLVEARPACRPKELLVAVPLPGAQPPYPAEITLKLDKPLAGKPENNVDVHWTGVPVLFTQNPFMLTMDAETAQVEGLKTSPCGAPPAKKRPQPKRANSGSAGPS